MTNATAVSRASLRVREVLLLLLLVVAAHGGSLRNDFLVLDDRAWIVDNPQVQAGLGMDSVQWAFTTRFGAAWQPLVWISWMADRTVFGPEPVGFHATNLALHAVATVLLGLALVELLGRRGLALLVAALYAVHPVQVEAVAWVAERKGLLAAAFWMLGLWIYARQARWPGPAGRLALFVAMLFGLMAKSSVLTLPFTLLLLDLWPRGTLDPRRAGSWGRAIAQKIELFALVPGFAIAGFAAQSAGGAVRAAGEGRVAEIVFAYAAYLRDLVWPFGLAPLRVVPSGGVSTPAALAAAVVLLGLTGLAWRFRARSPAGLAGWVWYLGNLAPFVGFVAVGAHFMADRYLLIPSVGVFLAVCAAGSALLDRARVPGRVAALLAVAVVLACGALSARQTGYWRDSTTLFARAVDVAPRNPLAEYWLGEAWAARDEHDRAVGHFGRARTLDPDYDLAWFEEGTSLLAIGRNDDAARAFEQYLARRPRQFKGWMNLGVAHGRAGRLQPALQCFERALEIDPDHELARANRDRARQALSTPPPAGRETP